MFRKWFEIYIYYWKVSFLNNIHYRDIGLKMNVRFAKMRFTRYARSGNAEYIRLRQRRMDFPWSILAALSRERRLQRAMRCECGLRLNAMWMDACGCSVRAKHIIIEHTIRNARDRPSYATLLWVGIHMCGWFVCGCVCLHTCVVVVVVVYEQAPWHIAKLTSFDQYWVMWWLRGDCECVRRVRVSEFLLYCSYDDDWGWWGRRDARLELMLLSRESTWTGLKCVRHMGLGLRLGRVFDGEKPRRYYS